MTTAAELRAHYELEIASEGCAMCDQAYNIALPILEADPDYSGGWRVTEFDQQIELETHLDVMARWSVRLAYEAWAEDDPWQDHYSEVGQYDFERILANAEQLLPADVTVEEFNTAYAFFESRVEKDTTPTPGAE